MTTRHVPRVFALVPCFAELYDRIWFLEHLNPGSMLHARAEVDGYKARLLIAAPSPEEIAELEEWSVKLLNYLNKQVELEDEALAHHLREAGRLN